MLHTLNKDIKLIKNQYGKYDFEFKKNDLNIVSGIESYKTGILIAVSTGYQELLKTGNSTYADFGNKSFTTLKRNKSREIEFELESYLTEVISKMRRTKNVNEITVTSNNNGYDVFINTTTITDEDVIVETNINDNISKTNTILYAKTELAYCNKNIPLIVDITLQNLENKTLLNDIVYIYINDLYVKTLNLQGDTIFKYTPSLANEDNVLKIVYKGNEHYNSSEYIIHFISEV